MVKRKSRHSFFRLMVRFVEYRVVHIDDTPHRLALGVGLGLFVAWMPAIGLHVIIVLALAVLCRANKFTGFAFVWISNPFTLVPIYYPSYLLGKSIFDFFGGEAAGTDTALGTSGPAFPSLSGFWELFSLDFWEKVFSFLIEVGPQLWVGGIIIGLFAGSIGYFVTYRFVTWHRKRSPHRRHRLLSKIKKKK